MTSPSGAVYSRIIRIINIFEDSVLVTLLAVMMGTAVLQIFLRNFFGIGLSWADPLLRILVLWVGMAGAILASREDNHIAMNVLMHFLHGKIRTVARIVVHLFTSLVCGVVAWYSYKFVLLEYQDQIMAFASVPVWLTESIIPLAFAVISVRYLVFALWLDKAMPSDRGDIP